MSEIFTIGQIRSFCERQAMKDIMQVELLIYFTSVIFSGTITWRAIVKISPILYKFLIQTIHEFIT